MVINEKDQGRSILLDIARTIGTLLIILAHVGAPDVVNEIRCFDVVLLVFVSGYCINIRGYGTYLWKRFKRLVFPAWILLVVLFCATWVACLVFNKEQIYSATKIIKSFFFLNGGIGFIWIVRIYLGIAILTPVLVQVNNCIKNDIAILAFSVTFILLNSFIARRYSTDNTSALYYIVEILAYSSIALLGYRYKQLRKIRFLNGIRYGVALLLISLICCIAFFCSIGFRPNEYKYPPVEPYLFYGIFVTALIFLVFNNVHISRKTALENAISKFSMLSYDTYLVHIFALSIFDLLEEIIKNTVDWKIKYLAVLVLSLIGAIVLDRIKILLKKKFVRA